MFNVNELDSKQYNLETTQESYEQWNGWVGIALMQLNGGTNSPTHSGTSFTRTRSDSGYVGVKLRSDSSRAFHEEPHLLVPLRQAPQSVQCGNSVV